MLPPLALSLLACLPLSRAAAAPPEDLAALYPATLAHEPEHAQAYDWTCRPEDVWRVSGFSLEVGKLLELQARASTVVIGQHEGNALWAVVLPDKPFTIDSTIGGGGEKARHVWLRFHPSRLGELFPARTVRGHGEEEARFEAYRIYVHKVDALWSSRYEPAPEGEPAREYFSGYRPIVPPEDELVVDIDTEEGPRRVYSVDLSDQTVRLRGAYLTKALARPRPVERADALAAWERSAAIGRTMLDAGLEAEVGSWDDHVRDTRRAFLGSKTDLELARSVHVLLRPFHDPWVTLRCGEDHLPAYRWDRRPQNASWGGVKEILGKVTTSKGGISSGRTPYGIGYVLCTRAKDEAAVEEFDAVLHELRDTWGLIVDLRFGLEGERALVERMAGRFVEQPTRYARLVVPRAGEGEDVEERVIEPRGPWPWRGHVWALIGPSTMLEAEALALAIEASPKGATMGEPSSGLGMTAGWEPLPGGIELFRRSGRTLDGEDRPLPPDGILPDVPILCERTELGPDKDPVLWHALEQIYLVPHPERLQAKSQAPFPWPGDPSGNAASKDAGADGEEGAGVEASRDG